MPKRAKQVILSEQEQKELAQIIRDSRYLGQYLAQEECNTRDGCASWPNATDQEADMAVNYQR